MLKYGVVIEGEVTGEEISLPASPRKLETDRAEPFRVPYSYVDLNGHMNNTRYFDLAEDLIPAAAAGRRLCRASVEYACEARLGEKLSVAVEEAGDCFYISGDGEKKIFRMVMEYR